MNSPSQEKEVILILADISGYTNYMVSNAKARVHAQVVISELMESIIRHIEIPLEISKLEGDAVFLYACKNEHSSDWGKTKMLIGQKLLTFFEAFSSKLENLMQSNICSDCMACKNMHLLRLKVLVHSGTALFYRLGKFEELSGVDVILAHRLLKNTVEGHEYILMTEAAKRDIHFEKDIALEPHTEDYDHIGKVHAFVYYPHGKKQAAPTIPPATYWQKIEDLFRKVGKPFLIKRGLLKMKEFKNM